MVKEGEILLKLSIGLGFGITDAIVAYGCFATGWKWAAYYMAVKSFLNLVSVGMTLEKSG